MTRKDGRYFEMTISIGLVGCEKKVQVGPVPEHAIDEYNWPDEEYWKDALWEELEVTFEEIDKDNDR